MRKYFTRLALNYKFNEEIKDFSIETMYNKMKFLSVPINDWQQFIKSEFR